VARSHALVAGHPSAAPLLDLQRSIGNQAVQRLLVSRQPVLVDAPVAGLLSPAQVQAALRFYISQPARYTRDIIMQIQFEVGGVPTGKMSAADVQLVAKRQEELNVNQKPALKIDGMAGPRTLPSIFKIGLAKGDELAGYTKEAREMFANRGTKSEEEVAKELADKVLNEHLEKEGVPHVPAKVVDNLGSRGAFSNADWELKLDRLQFQPGDKHDIKETTATIYHEGRHAEQDFLVARMLAGRKLKAEQITLETGLKPEIAAKAVDLAVQPGTMEAVIAEGWHDSLNSAAGLERRRRNSIELKAAFKERETAREAFKKDPSPANLARKTRAEARFDKAVAEHDDLPHEFDAERLEDQVERQF
jgi:hypothetical protein